MYNFIFDDSILPKIDNDFLFNENNNSSNFNFFGKFCGSLESNSGDFRDYLKEDSQPILNDEKEINLNAEKKDIFLNNKNKKEKNFSTNYKTLNIIINKNKVKIFEIKKVNKKSFLGRKKKNQFNIYNEKTHTKSGQDNILIKIKRKIYNHSLKFVNLLLKKSKNKKIKIMKLYKNDICKIITSNIKENEALLNLTLKEIFSGKLSRKYKYIHKDYNKIIIPFILEQNDEIINEVLNKTFKEMLEIYRSDRDDNNIYKYFKRLNDDINDFEEQEYRESYKNITLKYESVLAHISPRKKRQN